MISKLTLFKSLIGSVVLSLTFNFAQAQLMTLTHSTSQTIVAGNSAGCVNANGNLENRYYRTFKISDFVATSTFEVSVVNFGVEAASSWWGDQPLTIKLYSTTAAAPTLTNMTLLSTFTGLMPDVFSPAMFDVPITATIAGSATLVVEISVPDGQLDNNFFFIGSNSAGQTAPSYIYAPNCSITSISDFTNVTTPSPVHIILNITGTAAFGPPGPFVNPLSNVCENSSVTYMVPNTAGVTYAWSYSGTGVNINSSGNSAVLTFSPGATSGTLGVTANNGSTTSAPRTLALTVNPSPSATVFRNGNDLSTGNFNSYAWYRNNNPIAGANSNQYTITQNGDYFVKVTQSNNCTGSSDTIAINDHSGTATSNLVATHEVNVYPNPASTELLIKSPIPVNTTMYSVDGRLVHQQSNTQVMALDHIQNGIYFLNITDKEGNNVKRTKIIVAK